MNSVERAITETRNWINNVVVGCNFCPFAARELKLDTIHYQVESSTKPEAILQAFLNECKRLDDNETIETSLLILTEGYLDFDDYLDLVDLAEQLIEAEDYEGTYQVASFHPDYRFAGAAPDDPANFTNRSIYPMLHLLREDSIERVLENFRDPDSIPSNNMAFAKQKGFAAMEALRKACLVNDGNNTI
ncbi:DUF1415 domain-containing protein [Flavitalea sp.]|nr:DUF1415 domain-containing protein [Flavitalea sp.]